MILNDPVLFDEWKLDIRIMAHRIIDMRYQLHAKLTNELKTPGNWDHIINQIGMFRSVLADSFCKLRRSDSFRVLASLA